MNGKQLKNSILQWAIQGKLVPQDPNDEPASVLLDKIRQEKERLIKEKKIKRDKNASIIYRGEDNSYYEKMLATGEVKCIDEEVPFEIPQGWEWERIGNLFETTSGSTPLSRNPDYYQNGSINWVRTTDLNNGVLCKTEIQITEKACSDYNLTILPQNSVCIAMYGGAGTIGKHSILQFDTTINQSVCAIKPNGYCNMDYLHTFIEYQRPYWMDFAAGSRKDPNINQLIIKHCLLPIPPQKEQTRIVEKLSLLHPYITQYGECQIKLDYINKEILDKFKKSILQEAIQGKLVPQLTEEGTAQDLLEQIKIEKQILVKGGKLKKSALATSVIFRGDDNKYYEQIGKNCVDITEEIPFEIPNNWTWARMGQVGDWGAGSTPQRGNQDYYGGNILWLKTGELNNDIVYDTEEKITQRAFQDCSLRMNKIGDVLIAMYGATIGKLAIVGKELTTNQACCGCTPYVVYNWFLFYFLMASRDSFIKKGEGGAQPNISRVKLVEHLIPLPPLNEQKRIVKRIETLFEQLH
ncbi:MAG: restriction endonuclease subunit S [Prevotella sp.]|nr:restriction endonuclease subunit S [Prevotella sp.]MBD9298361.1 restriction endonuclease subunit S [Prevotella sp.]